MNEQLLQQNIGDAKHCYAQAATLLKKNHSVENTTAAINFLTKAANLGLAEAQYQMGVMYMIGEYVDKNEEAAYEWFNKASSSHFIPAQFALATLHSQNENYTQAFGILTRLAKQDITEAQTNLANLYLQAKGAEKNVKKAVTLLLSAADKGDRFAQYRLGQLYYQGKEVPTDYIRARKYVVMAMEQRYLQAYLIMGSMLEHGFGIDKDVVRAYTFYNFCRHHGLANLDDLISDVFGTLNDIEKQQAKQFALEYCQNEPSPIY